MADDLNFSESPWDDQVSLSHHNSSTSSLDNQDNANSHSSQLQSGLPPHFDDNTVSTVNTSSANSARTADSSSEAAAATTTTTTATIIETGSSIKSPVRSRIKSSYRPRNRKVTEMPIEEADPVVNPLGPLGESSLNSENNNGPQLAPDGSSVNDHSFASRDATGDSGSLDDVPLNVGREQSSVGEHDDDEGDKDLNMENKMRSLSVGSETGRRQGKNSLLHPNTTSLDSNSNASGGMFDISVEDPIKIGDITSAHTVYTVHTKTTSPSFSKSEMSVTRRYRDFRWLYHALEHNNHGVIIPPPPEKQAMGRFNEDFVDKRRAALQTMMNKIAAHPTLSNDPDFKVFLESDNFVNDVKNRVVTLDELDQTSSSGFMNTLGDAFSFSSKFVESSQWYIDKKLYVDTLESQLKSLYKALDLVLSQRRELSDATGEFANVIESLGEVEFSKQLSELLLAFSQVQARIQDLYSRQCMQDILSLSTTLDEYIRLVSSIRSVFAQRQKAYFAAQNAEHELSKKRSQLDKLLRQGKSQQDKLSVLRQDVEEQENKVTNLRITFDDLSKVIMQEFERFEHQKIADFRNAVELFLENAVEAQKEAIEVWETFYQRGFAKVGA